MKTFELDRETLYAAVWERPLTKVAAEYGISDVALKKICRKMEVPTPWRGYWRRRELGYKTLQPRLPKLSAKGVAVVAVQGQLQAPAPEPPVLPPVADIQRQIATVPQDTDDHPLAAGLLTSLNAGKVDERQVLQPRAKRASFIMVSRDASERIVGWLNTFFRSLEANAIKVRVDTEQSPVLRLTVDGEELGLTVTEKIHRKERELSEKEKRNGRDWMLPRHHYFPSGTLTVHIHGHFPYGTRATWTDGKRAKLEDKVAEVVRGVIALGKAQTQRRIDDENRKREWEEERRRYEEAEQLRRRQKQLTMHLEKLAGKWRQAEDLRLFIAAVEARQADLGDIRIQGLTIPEWLERAKAYAEANDPLCNSDWWNIDKLVPSWEVR
jgi:hypothetical protein